MAPLKRGVGRLVVVHVKIKLNCISDDVAHCVATSERNVTLRLF